MMINLTREIRFGLHDTAPDSPPRSANGFAANPALTDLAPFLTLAATVTGPIDPATGMLVNIKIVDRILREHAVPLLRHACYIDKIPAAHLLPRLFNLLTEKFAPHNLAALTLTLSPFLSLAITHKEPHMVRLSQHFEFSAAHRLHSPALSEKQNVDLFGRCQNPNGHGHNYELEVTLAGIPDLKTGQVLPLLELQRLVNKHILDVFDHKHLNLDCPEFKDLNPTVENIARIIYEKLAPKIQAPTHLAHVRVWETPKTVAQYGDSAT